MRYPVTLPGFEGQEIVVEPPGFFSGPKLLVNGRPAPKGRGRGELIIRRNDGKDMACAFRHNFLDVPSLMVDGKPLDLVEPLKWYEWVWNGWPVFLVIIGGAFGAVIGLLAVTFNLRLFRSVRRPALKYIFSAMTGIGASLFYLGAATLFRTLIR
ncbi:MAG: hypothetical protein HFACDABA_01821 [Anaerolineales bacterium]|nr:hypothetical protein [Anaerolineales bacterium]